MVYKKIKIGYGMLELQGNIYDPYKRFIKTEE